MDASPNLIPSFADFANNLASYLVPLDFTFHQRKKFLHDVKKLFWDESYLYLSCTDQTIYHCMPEVEMLSVLEEYHSSPVCGNHSGIRIA